MATIIFEPSTNKMTVTGVKGKKCMDFTKDLEKALGKVENRKKTQEYYQKEKVKQTETL